MSPKSLGVNNNSNDDSVTVEQYTSLSDYGNIVHFSVSLLSSTMAITTINQDIMQGSVSHFFFITLTTITFEYLSIINNSPL